MAQNTRLFAEPGEKKRPSAVGRHGGEGVLLRDSARSLCDDARHAFGFPIFQAVGKMNNGFMELFPSLLLDRRPEKLTIFD
jgi:hypothetical protein